MAATMKQLFQFEQDKYYALRRIPMVIRMKLDLCGIKLSIRDWSKFSRPDREQLVDMACDSADQIAAFRARLTGLIEAIGGDSVSVEVDPDPAWRHPERVPPGVQQEIAALGLPAPSQAQWAALSPLQRFAMIKLTRAGHENKNLLPALKEFGLI
jgi:hypothetical protein